MKGTEAMKLINNVKGVTTERTHYFDVLRNYYDNSNEPMKMVQIINVFNRTYVIDKKVDINAETTIIYAHRYDTTRKLYHELVYTIDWNTVTYYYDIKKYSIA